MPQGCFIGIDQGSSSTKALVVSAAGAVLFTARKALPPPFREGARVEHDALDILRSVQEALDESILAARNASVPVLGIGLSCQRSSCLIWNEATGEPLSPVLSWRDTRGAGLIEGLAKQGDFIFTTTGLPMTAYYSASKFRWLKEHVPAAQQNTTVYGTLSSFLLQRLAGSSGAVIDHTNAARTQLMNIRTLSWDEDLLNLFGLSGIRLPKITPTGRHFGLLRTSGEEIPLLASLGDQQAAMIGLGVVEKRDGGINYGTGGFLMVNTGSLLTPAPNLMASIHYSTDSERYYLLEGSVNAVGDGLEWLRARLGLFADYEAVDDLCWKAATDVVAFIGINGTGAPHWETGISSAFHGLTTESAAADLVRGVVEGIAFFMKDIADAIEAAGVEPFSFAVSGGLSSLTYLTQVQADVLGGKLFVSAGQEVSALGAALLAGMVQGVWGVDDVRRAAAPVEAVEGRKNPAVEKRYRRWKELHRVARALDRLA